MNHYGIGSLHEDCTLTLPQDILRPISVETDVNVWGLYYPETLLEAERQFKDRIDFVLSPLPYEMWPVSARIVVHTKHDHDAFAAVAAFLNSRGVSILTSEASRSAHRYDTWSLIVAFDELADISPNEYSERDKAYKPVLEEVSKLRSQIAAACGDYLHIEPSDVNLAEPIDVKVVHSMAYFHYVTKTSQFRTSKEKWHYHKPFKLRCEKGSRLVSNDGEFSAIVDTIDQRYKEVRPCSVFAEAQPADMNLRVLLIPKAHEAEYFGVTLKYRRSGPPPTSRGLTYFVMEKLADAFRVLAINNQSLLYSLDSEMGRMYLVLRDQISRTITEREATLRATICTENLPEHLNHITKVDLDCYRLSVLERVEEIEAERPTTKKFDIFLTYAREDERYAEQIETLLEQNEVRVFRDNKLETGVRFDDELRTKLLESIEVVVLCSPQSVRRDWVTRELGAAWVLQMKVNNVVLHMQREDLPEGMKEFQSDYFEDVIRKGADWDVIKRVKARRRI